MKYYSTSNHNTFFSFREAAMHGLAPDGGLFMPKELPHLANIVADIKDYSFNEIAFEVISHFVGKDIPNKDLKLIIDKALNFPVKLVELDDALSILELFHGPTLAFKDFGARFMAGVMEYFTQSENEELNILVATSGDTGSAVASGFLGKSEIHVYILFPSGKVSEIQKKQLTTMGGNITALEINGTFDDCQRFVKTAFLDSEIIKEKNLSSANSINIARLLPQATYYFEAFKLAEPNSDIVFSVPSGNLGNLTAGLFANKMGLPVNIFIAATNVNRVFTDFLSTGKYLPQQSIKTLSNAMDVGSPSNLDRIRELYNNDISILRKVIFSSSYNDKKTIEAIKEIYNQYNYVIDPHGAIGYLSLKEYFNNNEAENTKGIILETAHPAKFKSTVDEALNIDINIPDRLSNSLRKETRSVKIENDYNKFKNYLLTN